MLSRRRHHHFSLLQRFAQNCDKRRSACERTAHSCATAAPSQPPSILALHLTPRPSDVSVLACKAHCSIFRSLRNHYCCVYRRHPHRTLRQHHHHLFGQDSRRCPFLTRHTQEHHPDYTRLPWPVRSDTDLALGQISIQAPRQISRRLALQIDIHSQAAWTKHRLLPGLDRADSPSGAIRAAAPRQERTSQRARLTRSVVIAYGSSHPKRTLMLR